MKTSVQVLAGVVTGALLALLLPVNSVILSFITSVSTTVLSLGRYLILPLLFFSLIVSVSQLQREKVLFKNFIKALGLTAAFTFLLVIIGILASLLFSPGQIPVVIDGLKTIDIPGFKELFESSFPNNIFSVFQGNFDTTSNQFVPFFVLALILGVFLTKSSREEVEPTFNLVDSLSRIFFNMNHYFLKISYLWVAILTAAYITLVRNIVDLQIFLPLSYMLIVIAVIIIFIIYPIIYYYICGRRNPLQYLVLEFPAIITGLTTGDLFFSNVPLIVSQKKAFRVKRESTGFNIPFLTLFSKSGTALVTVITFIVILKSYSSLEITASQILWVGIISFLVSFCLPTKAVGGSIASLFMICSLYPDVGLVDSFIILLPAFPIIAGVSTMLNIATIILINIIMDPEKKKL